MVLFNQSMVARMAERAPRNQKASSLNPALDPMRRVSKYNPYLWLYHNNKPQTVPTLKQLSRAVPSQEWSITMSTVPTQEAIPEEGGRKKNGFVSSVFYLENHGLIKLHTNCICSLHNTFSHC